MFKIIWILVITLISLLIGGFAYLAYMLYPSLPPWTEIKDRLNMFPKKGHKLKGDVEIFWNEYQIPYIFAEHDLDGAYTMGLVHAHLRLGHMEVFRRIAKGEIASVAGPIFADIDHTLKILDFTANVDETWEKMPEESRKWVLSFIDGLNFYIKHMEKPPLEFEILNIKPKHWSYRDVLAVNKLVGTDINWISWASLLDNYNRPDWKKIWQSLLQAADSDSTSFTYEGFKEKMASSRAGRLKTRILEQILFRNSRNGSNSIVIDSSRSKSGKPIIANDPHLGISLPNFWLIGGLKTPTYDNVGMMIAGVPVFAFGRNREVAWGGTNLRNAASDLVDVSDLDPKEFTTKKIRINERFWIDDSYQVRHTKYGPVISDSHLLPSAKGKTLALKWIGHAPSDEITSMLKAGRAKNWDEFYKAFENFAVPAQNILYADAKGNIGQLIASYVPRRTEKAPEDLIISTSEADEIWSEILNATQLPHNLNPKEGFVASSNNKPVGDEVIIGYFFPIPDRIKRIKNFIASRDKLGFKDMVDLQHDVHSESGVELRDILMEKIDALGFDDNEFLSLVRNWDGYYRIDSCAALAFHALYSALAPDFYKAVGRENDLDWMRRSNYMRIMLVNDLKQVDEKKLRHIFEKAIRDASKTMKKYNVWGDAHRIKLKHFLGNLPIFGGRFRYRDIPTGGSNDTVMKTAHTIDMDKPHGVYYGAQARHISDMSDIDENYFVLLGGQDGWHNSSTFMDQMQMWLNRGYIKIPMSEKKIRREFSYNFKLEK